MTLIVGFWGVRYQVKDVQRSIGFYTQTLGFNLDMISAQVRTEPY